jgi:hypothetical protein
MGTTLTGTTPQDTYDSLIKVTDNGPISGTLKALSDGLGNDSTLSLSTTAASIAGTLAVAGAATFDTTTLVVDATNNRVGVGTISPTASLDAVAAVSGTYSASNQQVVARIFNSPSALGSGVNSAFLSLQTTPDGAGSNPVARIGVVAESYGSNDASFVIATRDFSGISEKVRVLSSGGITFNGDTAAANALDDYEEGTWTMGVSFGGASVGVTTTANTGTYTKIGRQVTVNGIIVLSSKGSSVGAARITGLPFTIASSIPFFPSITLRFSNITFLGQVQGYGSVSTTAIELEQITELGVSSVLSNTNFANNTDIMVSLTYFV